MQNGRRGKDSWKRIDEVRGASAGIEGRQIAAEINNPRDMRLYYSGLKFVGSDGDSYFKRLAM